MGSADSGVPKQKTKTTLKKKAVFLSGNEERASLDKHVIRVDEHQRGSRKRKNDGDGV